jgi:hypothetical protein
VERQLVVGQDVERQLVVGQDLERQLLVVTRAIERQLSLD